MFKHKPWPFLLLLLWLGIWAISLPGQLQAQTVTPSPPTATPLPTAPPAILILQPTPVPTPPLSGSPAQQFWQTYQTEIITIALSGIIGSILIGVFLQRIATTIADGLSRLFHFLFDRMAAAPFIRWRYEKKYRQSLATAVQELQSGNLVERVIPLEKMYVPALLTEETQPNLRRDAVDRFRSRDERRYQQQQRAVGPWEAMSRFHRFVILGAPGIGKTTCLYHIAYLCAHRRQPEWQHYLPIFIRFRELVTDFPELKKLEDSFPRLLANKGFPNAHSFITQQLQQGQCLILLDGLDEVSNQAEHERMVTLTQAFADQYVSGPAKQGRHNRLIISCRTYSYEHGMQLTGFPKTEVMEFDDPTMERFVHNWFPTRQDDLAAELLTLLHDNPRFRELARNPLLLLLIAYHYERERHLPRLRAELYEHCIHTRIIHWNTKRGTHHGRFGEQDKRRLLRDLALHIFQNSCKEGLLWHQDLLAWVETFAAPLHLPADTSPAALLDEVIRTSGLIQEWAIDRYGFSHHTLQEYFAADAARLLGPDQGASLLGHHLHDPAWKEVLLLYCGLADNPAPLLQRLVGQAQQPGSPATLWLLAGLCLAEGARQVTLQLRQQVSAQLITLLRVPAGGGRSLSADERGQAIASLSEFATDLLLPQLHDLLAGSSLADPTADLLLAAQLLPPNAPAELRRKLSRRLSPLVQSADAATQQAALAALGRLGLGEESVAPLLAGLLDADAPVRAEAALSLARLGQADAAAAQALRQVYAQDPQDRVRHAALTALLALGYAAEVGMVPIPAGEFRMGSADSDNAAKETEKPPHSLYLPAYFIDRTPVTNAQFRQFMQAGGYANPAYWPEAQANGQWAGGKFLDFNNEPVDQPRYWQDSKWNGETQPVVGVSWYEALAYARWAGKRLPTEAEWEKAARGRDGLRYPWGNEWDAARLNSQESRRQKTTPVGQFSPAGDSPYGVADMAGNVWEWCSTRWQNEQGKAYPYPYTPDDGRETLTGGEGVVRVLRGGSWKSDQKWTRCAVRLRDYPWLRYDGRGFRCCCAPSSLPPGSGS